MELRFWSISPLSFMPNASVSEQFKHQIQPLLPTIKEMFLRSLVGHGHPCREDVAGMISDVQINQDNQDPGYRARRLVKMISGLEILPTVPKIFAVSAIYVTFKILNKTNY